VCGPSLTSSVSCQCSLARPAQPGGLVIRVHLPVARDGPPTWALQRGLHGGANVRGCGCHRDARSLERLDLVLGFALAAGDDGAGVAHATSRGRGAPGDEARHGLLDVLADELCGLFFGRAADLTDHDDAL